VGHLAGVPEHARQEIPVHVLPRVAGVGGQDQIAALSRAHPEGLVAGRVAVRREQHDRAVAEDVVLPVDRPVRERMIEVLGARGVALLGQDAGVARRLELLPLDEERRSREEFVPAAVVEVKVGVRDPR
jgi:hypothetical protein